MIECSFTNSVIVGSSPVAVTETSDFVTVSIKEFLEIQATIECGFTLKRVSNMTRACSQIHRTDKYSLTTQLNHLVSLAKWSSVRLQTK